MPLYEYQCNDCKNVYEILTFSREDGEETVCPKCHSQVTTRLVSAFAVGHGGGPMGDIPSCSDGSCHSGCGGGHCDFDDE